MKKMMRKTVAFLLVAAMMIMNLGAMAVAAANDEGEKKEAAAEKVASPAANPKAGTYDGVQKVTLSTTTKDAVIYYTVNGDTPSEKSTKFDSKKPIEVQESSTVKAIAVKDGMTKSDVVSFTYTINADKDSEAEGGNTETPAATPAETAAPEPTQTEEPAKTPSEEGQATLGAPAEQENTGDTETPPATPTGSPAATETPDTDAAIGAVVISADANSAANITVPAGSKLDDYKALDKYKVFADKDSCSIDSVNWELTDKTATTPDTAATVFTEGNKYTCTIGLSAKAGYVFGTDSAFTMNGVTGATDSADTAKREYKFAFTVPAAPTAEPATGSTVKSSGKITLSAGGAAISYKVNDDADWSVYADDTKVAVKADADSKCKVTAKAVLNGFESAEAVFEYTVDPTPETLAPPTASPSKGTYDSIQKVTLKAKDGADIRYTTDGKTDPTRTTGTVYKKGDVITVDKNMTIKAIAYTDSVASAVATYEYIINLPDEKKLIKKVSVLDVTGAARGTKPKESASVADSAHSTVESVEWTDTEKNALETSKVFKAGTVYYVYIHLQPKKGYEYDVDALKANSKDNIVVTVNGNRASVSSVSKTDLVVLGAFKTADAAKAEGKNCTITGLSSSYAKGATITFTANGAGSSNPEKEGNERFIPIKYSVSNSSYEMSEGTPSIQKSIRINTSGTYTLKVTFQKEVYSADKGAWVRMDETTETTASLKINTTGTTPRTTSGVTKAATTTPKAGSTNSKSSGAKTGDETPIGAFVGIAVLAGAAIVVLVAARKKKRTK